MADLAQDMVFFRRPLVVGILFTATVGVGAVPWMPASFRAGNPSPIPALAGGLRTAPLPAARPTMGPFRPADPVGAYCILERVVVDPGDDAPGRIQMWGAFVLADSVATGGYGHASRGLMYYLCPPGRSTACKNEWADLRWISGTGKAIGYGLRGKPIGRLRREDEAVAPPDSYPLDGGLVKVESKDPAFTDLVAQLKAALAGRPYLTARTFVASITNIPRP